MSTKIPEDDPQINSEMKAWGEQTLGHLLQFASLEQGQNDAETPEALSQQVGELGVDLWKEACSRCAAGEAVQAVSAEFIKCVLDEVARGWTPRR